MRLNKGKERGWIRKTQSKRKGESEIQYTRTTKKNLMKGPKLGKMVCWGIIVQNDTMIAMHIKQDNA